MIDAFTSQRTLIAAAVLLTLWGLEAVAPMFRGRRRRLRHAATNLALALANATLAAGFIFALAVAAEASERNGWGVLHRAGLDSTTHTILALLLFDAWQYLWHRLNHRVAFLWRFHAVHHSDAELDVSSGVRFHPVEIALSSFARLAVVPLIGMSLPMLALYEAISLPIILFHHSNIRIGRRLDDRLRWLIVTPWMHWVHHSHWQPETDSNYASMLSVWDRVFGTYRLRDDPERITLGLDEWREQDWRDIRGMLVRPLRPN